MFKSVISEILEIEQTLLVRILVNIRELSSFFISLRKLSSASYRKFTKF